MKKFFIKLIVFCLPLVFLAILSFLFFRAYGGRQVVMNDLYAKIRAVVPSGSKPDVIIAGDSRASLNLDPKAFNVAGNPRVVNIATRAGYITDVATALRRFNITKPNTLVIVSVSYFEVNDEAWKGVSLPPSMYSRLGFFDEIKSFDNKFDAWYQSYADFWALFIRQRILRNGFVPTYGNLGFEPQQGIMALPVPTEDLKNHPWYNPSVFPGWKWEAFKDALKDLAGSGNQIVIYSAPPDPAWKKITQGTAIASEEELFSKKLNEEVSKYLNVHFLDLYHENFPELTDEYYYDTDHLNSTGAQIFSKLFVQKLAAKGLLPIR